MRKNVLVLAVCGLIFVSKPVWVSAAENVYIDYSALDDLAPAAQPVIHTQPLFPVVKKTSVRKSRPAVKKASSRKAQEPKIEVKVIEKTKEPEIKAPSEPAPVLPTVKPESEVHAASEQKSAPEVEVVTETITEVYKMEENGTETQADKTAEKVSEKNEQLKTEDISTGDSEAAPQPLTTTELDSEMKKDVPSLPTVGEGSIYFETETAPLSEANKKQIDAILKGFENPSAHKIAIHSYNIDSGEDVFKKKRQSLDRAIAVRSYLLERGYKDFSIKVVMVADGESRANRVDLLEMK